MARTHADVFQSLFVQAAHMPGRVVQLHGDLIERLHLHVMPIQNLAERVVLHFSESARIPGFTALRTCSESVLSRSSSRSRTAMPRSVRR